MNMRSTKARIVTLSIVNVAFTALVLMGIIYFQKHSVEKTAIATQGEIGDLLIESGKGETAKIAHSVYLMCRAMNETIKEKVASDLNVARDRLNRAGHVSFAEEYAEWSAVNQFTKAAVRANLPKMLVGEQWLGQNDNISYSSPIVDEVKKLVGGTCTIFQRMNDAGDMLRVCTNVETLDGKRAVGTFIPAVNPDGKPNPVVSSLLRNESYIGRAYVVNAWYLTAYEPIRDVSGKVVGALYVGVKQESTESLRQGIMDMVVGKTGYVYVLGGKGDQRGRYIISLKGTRDGEDIWGAKDSDGNLFIQSIINKGVATSQGSVDYETYPWINQGENEARLKIAAITYFEPWDWVIGAGTYLSDFEDARKASEDSFNRIISSLEGMIFSTGGIAAILIVVFSLAAIYVTSRIVGPLRRSITTLTSNSEQIGAAAEQVAASSQTLAEGASEQASAIQEVSSSLEEMASMTKQNADNANQAKVLAGEAQEESAKGNEAMNRMREAVEKIKSSSDQTAKILKTIDEIAFQTNLLALNAAVEAARAGEAGKGFAVVAEEVRNLAQRSAEAAKNTANMISESVQNAENGVKISEEVAETLARITLSSKKVNDLVAEIAAASNEQSQGIGQINTATGEMDKSTQGNAANAEESSSASQELAAQAIQLNDVVRDIQAVIDGKVSTDAEEPAAGKSRRQINRRSGPVIQGPTMKREKAGKVISPAKTGVKRAGHDLIKTHVDQAVHPEKVIPLNEEEMAAF